jgi:hypothetical protein
MKQCVRLLEFNCMAVLVLLLAPAYALAGPGSEVLIVQGELPQMKVLAEYLREDGQLDVTIADHKQLPEDLTSYKAILVYTKGTLEEEAEIALIDYTKNGGRFIGLHHAISGAKLENTYYFDFLGIQIDSGLVEDGGFGFKHDITLALINLYPDHYITSHNVHWGERTAYTSSDSPGAERILPAFSLHGTEVFINHRFTDGREKTVLCGFKYYDESAKRLYMQDRAAWVKKCGQGEIVYFMPGHVSSDYENRNHVQMILNAIHWKP